MLPKLRSFRKYVNTSLSVSIIVVLCLLLILFLVFNNIHVFSGDRAEAIEMLGLIAQGSAALTAIVFAFLIYISQTIIGKYVSGTIEYLFKNRNFIILITFYSIATITITLLMWIFPKTEWTLLVDVSSSLLLIEIGVLPLLFFAQSKLLNPKTIFDTLLGRPNLKDEQEFENTIEKGNAVFSMVYKLAENKEFDAVTYGLKTITKTVNSPYGKNDWGLYVWSIPNYERIGVDCFRFDPNISSSVISQFNELVEQLKMKSPHTLFFVCSQISNACFNIAKAVAEKPYSEETLSNSSFLLQKIYVAKILADYDAFAYEELVKIMEIIKMMTKSNIQSYLMSLPIEDNCRKLLSGKKTSMMQALYAATLQAFPKNDETLQTFFNIILFEVPATEKETANNIKNPKNEIWAS